MANLRVVPVNAADTATLAASPAAAATAPVTDLQLIARDRSFRSTSLASQVISGHWGGDLKAVNAWALLRHNLLGAQVTLQLFSDAALTVEIYNSGVIDVYADSPLWGSFNWGEVPWGTPANDPLAIEAPFIRFLSPTIYAAGFKLTIANLGAMSVAYFDLGRLWLGEYLEAPYQARFGKQLGWESSTQSQKTRGGSSRPNAGARWRALRLDLFQLNDADRAVWMDLTARLDMNLSALWCLHPGAAGRKERDHTLEGLLEGLGASTHADLNFYQQPFVIKET